MWIDGKELEVDFSLEVTIEDPVVYNQMVYGKYGMAREVLDDIASLPVYQGEGQR